MADMDVTRRVIRNKKSGHPLPGSRFQLELSSNELRQFAE